jgi:hypothetical protein
METEDGGAEPAGRNPLSSICNPQSDNSAAGGRRLPGAVPETELTGYRLQTTDYRSSEEEKGRFRGRECGDLSSHNEPLSRTRRMQRK